MGKLWDKLTGADAAHRSQELLRQKLGFERGLSKKTMGGVEAGEVEIADEDPQAELLRKQAEQGD